MTIADADLAWQEMRIWMLAHASHLAGESPKLRAEILIWPFWSKGSPNYWRDFCDRWPEYMALPLKGLSQVTAAAVLCAIVKAMGPNERGDMVTFLSYNTIAARAHVNRKSVQRVIAWQKDAPAPLFFAMLAGRTKGISHPTYRFTLIQDPILFAAKRDEARLVNCEAFEARYREQAPALRELQRAELLATDDRPHDLQKGLAAITDKARGTLPRKVVARMVTPSGSLKVRQDRVSPKTPAQPQAARRPRKLTGQARMSPGIGQGVPESQDRVA